MRKSGRSFKETVNDALRLGLLTQQKAKKAKNFKIPAYDMRLKPGYSLDKPRDLIEEIEGADYRLFCWTPISSCTRTTSVLRSTYPPTLGFNQRSLARRP